MIQIQEIASGISIGILDLRAFSIENNLPVKREQERAGTRFLLQNLLGTADFKLSYTPFNKPYLDNSSHHLSISHSHDKLVVILNHHENTGIDIELMRDKVLKIRHKYLRPDEAIFAGDDIEKLITIWAAKETMYKCYGLKNLDFIENLKVDNFDADIIFGKIETTGFSKKLRMVKQRIDDYVMVYVLNEVTENTTNEK